MPFYIVFLQLTQQMIVIGSLHAGDASTLYGRALQLNNLLIFSESVEKMEIRRFCIQMTLVIYNLF